MSNPIDAERRAYMAGDTARAALLVRIADLEADVERLEAENSALLAKVEMHPAELEGAHAEGYAQGARDTEAKYAA